MASQMLDDAVELSLQMAVSHRVCRQDEGRCLIGLESGGDNDVLSRNQSEELHDLPRVHKAFSVSHRFSLEEMGRQFPLSAFVLQNGNAKEFHSKNSKFDWNSLRLTLYVSVVYKSSMMRICHFSWPCGPLRTLWSTAPFKLSKILEWNTFVTGSLVYVTEALHLR